MRIARKFQKKIGMSLCSVIKDTRSENAKKNRNKRPCRIIKKSWPDGHWPFFAQDAGADVVCN